jgi:hypothetical protein
MWFGMPQDVEIGPYSRVEPIDSNGNAFNLDS